MHLFIVLVLTYFSLNAVGNFYNHVKEHGFAATLMILIPSLLLATVIGAFWEWIL